MAAHRRERSVLLAILAVFLAEALNAGLHRGPTFAGQRGLRATAGRSLPRVVRRQGAQMDRSVIPFGRHKGKTYKYVLKSDPSYCKFVTEAKDPSPAMQAFQEYLHLKGFNKIDTCPPVDKPLLGFGKYRDRTYEDILASDQNYCEFVLSMADPCPAAARFQSFLIDKEHDTIEVDDSSVIDIGKPQGKTSATVVEIDPDHREHVEALGDAQPSVQGSQQYRSERSFAPSSPDDDERVVSFGKHRGERFTTVVETDPDYCKWVMTLTDAKPSVQSFQDYLLERNFRPSSRDRRSR
mmetsp:Transcript_68889/g.165359  ORF Transcript_68889/g.165359 Transcript_68889/m.165359 type:complete len:295 (+) Transcript_68889:89-973(+)